MTDRDDAGRFQPGHNLPGPGRPSLYHPEMNEQARKLALLGLTDEEMAEFFGVSRQTLDSWKQEFPAFLASLMEGKVVADAEVANSLYKRATGEFVVTERLIKKSGGEFEIVKLQSYVPGDPSAAKLWLTNRRGQNWRDKQSVEHTFNHEDALDELDDELASEPEPDDGADGQGA